MSANKLWLLFLVFLTVFSHAFSYDQTFVWYGRNYYLIKPKNSKIKAPLIVLLHGCKQNAQVITNGTRLNENKNIYLLIPEQNKYFNQDHCFNWYQKSQQVRNPINEAGQIVSLIEFLKLQNAIDEDKIFAVGLSAGAALSNILIACYPDIFKGTALHSGLAFKSVDSIEDVNDVLLTGPKKNPKMLADDFFSCSNLSNGKLKKVMILHGENDPRVNVVNSKMNREVFINYFKKLDQNPFQSKFLRTQHLNNYTVNETHDTVGQFELKTVIVSPLKHAWGGDTTIDTINFDRLAPSSTKYILEFLLD